MAFIFGAPGLPQTREELARQREVQQALTAKLLGHTPQNVGEGLSAIGQALAIRGMRSRNEKAAEKGAESREAAMNPLIAALTGGGDFPAAPKQSPDYSPGAVTSAPLAPPMDEPTKRVAEAFAAQGDMGAYQDAIASIESKGSGDYSAIGPTDPKLGRALGRYQVMEANIGPWTKEALGYSMTPDDFLANPKAQDAVFNHVFKGYVDKYGPEGAAQAWFGGPGSVGKTGRRDVLGTSVGEYGDKFMQATGGAQPVQTAQNGPMDAATLPAMAGGTADVIQPGQKQNLLPLLIKASQNPWLTESQRGIVGALLKNELAKNDPTNALDVEYKRAQIEKMKAEAAKANNPLAQNKFGLNPQYGVDENGNPVILQLGSNGVAVETKLPEDVQLSKAPIKLDAGTEWILLDPITRQPVGRVAKNLGEAEAAKAQGKVQGEARASLPGDILNVQQAIKSIDELSANPGLDSIVGSADQFRPSWLLGPQGNDALARLDQLKGKTFLQAYTTLKGGGQITEVEGQKAENAIARLNRAQDEKTFRQALSDLRDVIVKGQKTMLEKAGIPQDQWSRYLGTSVPAQPGPATINGYTIEEVQ